MIGYHPPPTIQPAPPRARNPWRIAACALAVSTAAFAIGTFTGSGAGTTSQIDACRQALDITAQALRFASDDLRQIGTGITDALAGDFTAATRTVDLLSENTAQVSDLTMKVAPLNEACRR